MDRVYEKKLFEACQTLFGTAVDLNRDFLFYLQPSGIKSAFRRRALTTHPDRRPELKNGAQRARTELFITSRLARDTLLDFIERRQSPSPGSRAGKAPGTAKGRATRPAAGRKPYYYRGAVPRRTLRTGEYLFYRGAVPWEALIAAVVWQRRQRPRLGELALELGLLEKEQTRFEALRREIGEPVGEAMVRLGLLNRGQLHLLVSRQRRLQRLLGEFFVRRRYLSRERLGGFLEALAEHNRDCRVFRNR